MSLGLYIHIPFCASKCPYCDFYSFIPDKSIIDLYIKKVIDHIKSFSDFEFDTVYFGGGTPSYIGADYICDILKNTKTTPSPEITVECNPSDCIGKNGFDFSKAAFYGVNRISLGIQSAVDSERKALGRKAGAIEVEEAIKKIESASINNISLDVMLGTPGQTTDSVLQTLNFCVQSDVKHISAYILKIEENTFFGKHTEKYNFPDDDAVSEMYLTTCDYLKSSGFNHYEISNFCLPGYESKHNLKYWHCEEYIGIGPAAHSFFNGKRFYYSDNISDYINGAEYINDDEGGSFEEYVMLALRLSEGLCNDIVVSKFGHPIPENMFSTAKELAEYGLVKCTGNSISLTEKGFLISNIIIGKFLS